MLVLLSVSVALLHAAEPTWPQRLAAAQGLDQLDRVQEIRFTFQVTRADRVTARRWSYHPQTHVVELLSAPPEGLTAPVRYDRDDPIPEAMKKVDGWFINDSFWFLLPMHLSWAAEVRVEEQGQAEPELRRVGVQYPNTGGYTPGDRYELLVDAQDRVVSWSYFKSGAEPAALVTSWEDYRSFGPLTLSTTRKTADGSFVLQFVDVEVR